MTEHCEHCGRPAAEYPTCFLGERYCSDACRKALGLGPANRR